MPARDFLDTNVLVYAYDRHDTAKQSIAQEVLISGMREETAFLSTQVIGEFFTVVTRRIPAPLTIGEAREAIDLLSILPVAEIDFALTGRAIDTHERYGVGYWDSLIIAAAERTRCDRILSEDFSAGRTYRDIVVVNPFENAGLAE